MQRSILIIIFLLIFFIFPWPIKAAINTHTSVKQVRIKNDNTVYYLDHKINRKKAYLNEKVFLSYGNKWSDVKIINRFTLVNWPDVYLIKLSNSPAVYYIKETKKTLIKNEKDFFNFGFNFNDVLIVNKTDLDSYKNASYEELGLVDKIKKNKITTVKSNNILFANIKYHQNTFSNNLSYNKELKRIFYWPTDNRIISYYFNDSTYPFIDFLGQHNGIDIVAKQGSIVRAAASGTVLSIYSGDEMANFVVIEHQQDFTTVYGHLSMIKVEIGQDVKKGEIIGYIGGESGTSGAGFYTTGPHLHFEVLKNNIPVNPLEYLK